MLGIQATQNSLATIKSAAIRNHMQYALDAAMEIDKSALKVAYHAAAIKPLLEGNTDGLPTKYEDFAKKCFGLAKAEAYNVLTVGGQVALVTSTDGKKRIYIDEYTLANIAAKYDLATQWEEYYAAVKKARSLGKTQILTICRLQNKLNFDDSDISAMLETGALSAAMTIKEFEKAIKGKFSAIETTAKDETASAEGETSSAEGETAPAEGENAPAPAEVAQIQLNLGAVWVADTLMPELLRYADDSPAIADLIKAIKAKQ